MALKFILAILMTSVGLTSQDMCDNRAILSRLNSMEQEMEQLRGELNSLKKAVNVASETMFLASISSDKVVMNDQDILPWDTVSGENFNTVTHSFTAPVHGMYHFSVSVQAIAGPHYWLLVDSDPSFYCEIVAEHNPSCSITVNVELQAGQIVRLQKAQPATVHGTHGTLINSYFTGFLLYAL